MSGLGTLLGVIFGIGSFAQKNKANKELEALYKAQFDLQTRQVAYQDWVNRMKVKERGDIDALRKFGVDTEVGAGQADADLRNLAIARAQGIRDDYGVTGENQIAEHFLPGARTSQIGAARDTRVNNMMAGIQPTINKFTGKNISGSPAAWVNAANQVPALQEKLAQFKADRIGDISSAMQDTTRANTEGMQALRSTETRQGAMGKALEGDVNFAEEPILAEKRKRAQDISKSRSAIARGYDIPEKVFQAPDSTAFQKAKASSQKWDALGSIAGSLFS